MLKVIRGGTVVTATDTTKADVLIDGETIAAVGTFDNVDAEVIDASGCYVLPGLIDNHTHMSMPFGGTTSADDYDTGTQAAAAGGVTAIVDFGLQMEPDTQTFKDMQAMVDQGVSSFKVFLAYKGALMVTDDLFMQALERSNEVGGIVQVHAENGWVIDHLVTQALGKGQTTPIYHALTRPESVEAEATGRAIRIAEMVDAPVYIVHVSCEAAAQEIINARARGVHAYGETCIQYLFLDIEDLNRPAPEGARYVCSPPLRDASNQDFMWDALNFGHLQSISTDHCPFNDEQKGLGKDDFSKIPNGLSAVQHRLALMWEHGVKTGRMSPSKLVDVTSTAIAKQFGMHPKKGTIAAGADADLVIFDPNREHVFSTATAFSNVGYDLFDGRKTSGSARQTLSRGTVVFDNGKILTKPGHGRFIKRGSFNPATHGDATA
ncbi:MAG: dihydropyrimidinase [Actinobacteria bacterium]|nr:dihydropyrimidinase [Actinomycetota bacterium]